MKNSNKQSGFTIIELVIIVVVVGLIGLLAWIFFSRQHQTVKTSSTQASVQKTVNTITPDPNPATTPDGVIAKLKASLAAKYTLVDGSNGTNASAADLLVSSGTASPAYKVAGYNYFTSFNGGASLSVQRKGQDSGDPAVTQAANDLTTVLHDTLVANNLPAKGYLNNDPNTYVTVFSSDTLVCNTDEWGMANFDVKCALIGDIATEANTTKPIVEAIPDVTPTDEVSVDAVHNSQVAGYEWVRAGVGDIVGSGGSAYLYKKDGGVWTYFITSQGNGINCSSYNTMDLKNAFKGQACYDDVNHNTQSTVE